MESELVPCRRIPYHPAMKPVDEGMTRPNSGRSIWLAVLAGALPVAIGLVVHRQGFNFLDDGLWLLGGKTLAEGGLIYRDLFSIYGPARYVLLLPFFLIVGQCALALVLLKAVTDGFAAGLGFWVSRRLGARWQAWLIPIAVVALGPIHPRYVAAGILALLAGQILSRPLDRRAGLVLGLGWGVLCWFGLDAAGYGAVILLAGLLIAHAKPQMSWIATLMGGLGAALALPLLVAVVSGSLEASLWDTVVYPVTRFSQLMNVSFWDALRSHPDLTTPFSEVYTGENLVGAWPGHLAWRSLTIRVLYVAIFAVVPLAWWRCRGRADANRWGPLLGFALAGWITLLGRSDLSHLRMAWLGSLWILPALVAVWPGRSLIRHGLLLVLAILILGPLVGEKAWLMLNTGRDGLETWSRPTARVALAKERIKTIEQIFAAIPWDGQSPLLIWPAQPGLAFVYDALPPTAQATLLAGEVRSEQEIVNDLQLRPPQVILQGRSWGLIEGVRTIQQLVPEVWTHLRPNYYIAAQVRTDFEQYRILVQLETTPERFRSLEFMQQLPDIEHTLSNEMTPPLRPGMSIGQSLEVGALGFQGIVVRMSASRQPVEVPLVMRIWDLRVRNRPRELKAKEFVTRVDQDNQLQVFALDTMLELAGRPIAVTFEVTAAIDVQVTFSCLVHDKPDDVDYYPSGSLLVNGRSVAGDLYFLSF